VEVFFDPRKKAQQDLEDEKILTEKEEEKERNLKLGEQTLKVIADFAVKPVMLMLLWNITLPPLGLATITYFGAVGIYAIARILFKHD
jgi:hypothetical protein